MKDLDEMTNDELREEFDLYASETGIDRELDYDFEIEFKQWLDDSEVEVDVDED